MRETRTCGSEGGETGYQPVFPTPINTVTIREVIPLQALTCNQPRY